MGLSVKKFLSNTFLLYGMLFLLVTLTFVTSNSHAVPEVINSMNVDNAWGYSAESGESVQLTWSEIFGTTNYNLKYSGNNGKDWEKIGNSTTESYSWIVPLVDSVKSNSLIKVIAKDADGNKLGTIKTPEPFTINPPQPLALLSSLEFSYDSGEDVSLSWFAPVAAETVKIQITTDGGSSWETLANALARDGLQEVTLPFVNKAISGCQFKLTAIATDGSKLSADKSSEFSIVGPLEFTSPTGGEEWTSGSEQIVSWSVGTLPSPTDTLMIKYTINGGTSWETLMKLTGSEASATSVPWTIPLVDKEKSKTQLKVILKDADGNNLAQTVSESLALLPDPSLGDVTMETLALPPTCFNLGSRTIKVNGQSVTETFEYDAEGRCVKINGFNYDVNYEYTPDPLNPQLTKITLNQADFGITETEVKDLFYESDRLSEVHTTRSNPYNEVEKFTYNASGSQVGLKRTAYNGDDSWHSTEISTVEYDEAGRAAFARTEETSEDSQKTEWFEETFTYDDFGRLVKVSTIGWDPYERNYSDLDKFTYDDSGRMVKYKNVYQSNSESFTGVTTFTYASGGSLKKTTSDYNDNGQAMQFEISFNFNNGIMPTPKNLSYYGNDAVPGSLLPIHIQGNLSIQ